MVVGQGFRPFLNKRTVVEAVGMWESRRFCGISKGGGKGGKPGFRLSMLSTGRHFHGLLVCCCFSSFLLSCESPPEAIGFGSGLEDVRSVGDSVQQRLAETRVWNHLGPF
jgi:hypothetical protein